MSILRYSEVGVGVVKSFCSEILRPLWRPQDDVVGGVADGVAGGAFDGVVVS